VAEEFGCRKTNNQRFSEICLERKQFGTLISSFGAIKYKLANQVFKLFATESAAYRVSSDIDQLMEKLKKELPDPGRASIEAISHYAVEAAILKVYGSEMLDYVVDGESDSRRNGLLSRNGCGKGLSRLQNKQNI
jgi:alkylation response protein AidB-like acyl-CoA dehydrogenase